MSLGTRITLLHRNYFSSLPLISRVCSKYIQTAQREMIELSQKPEIKLIAWIRFSNLRDLRFVKRVLSFIRAFQIEEEEEDKKKELTNLTAACLLYRKSEKLFKMQRKQKLFNAAGQNISSRINQVR